jgi:hypothetical protein
LTSISFGEELGPACSAAVSLFLKIVTCSRNENENQMRTIDLVNSRRRVTSSVPGASSDASVTEAGVEAEDIREAEPDIDKATDTETEGGAADRQICLPRAMCFGPGFAKASLTAASFKGIALAVRFFLELAGGILESEQRG